MTDLFKEIDDGAVARALAGKKPQQIWAQEYPDHLTALQAFIDQADSLARRYEDCETADMTQATFDNQLSQFVRRYVRVCK